MRQNKNIMWLAGLLIIPVLALSIFTHFELGNKPLNVHADLASSDPACKDQNGNLLNPAPANTLTNTATVSSATQDPNSANNTDIVCNQIQYITDLSITKTHSPAAPTPGSNVTYTITVTNAGPSTSTGVTIADTLPAGLSNPQYSIVSGGGTFDSSTGQWTGLNLTAGSSATLQIVATVDNNTSGTIVNTAVVSPLGPTGAIDPTPDNGQTPNTPNSLDPGSSNPNGARDEFTVTPQADLSLLKTSSGNFVAGSSATYTLKVTNNGPSSATNLTITDTLPNGTSFDQSGTNTLNASNGWSCTASGQTVTCTNPGPLANGAESTAFIKINIAA
jgi:uncharacterized repeat protein (TIGR01451 family)